MTRPYARRPGRAEREHSRAKRITRLLRDNCRETPATPTGLAGGFDKVGATRHRRWRLPVKWDEVSTNTAGIPMEIRDYVLEVQESPDGSEWLDHSRHHVPAKRDDDAGEKAHFTVRDINPKLWYRWRVLARGRSKCKSAWSDWESEGNPGPDEPPAPNTVRILRANNGVELDWRIDDDPDDPELVLLDVDHFVAELYDEAWDPGTEEPDPGHLVERRRRITHTRVKFQIDADPEALYYGRVLSISASEHSQAKSAWIAATKGAGNSDPDAAPEGVRPLIDREIHSFSIIGSAEVKTYRPSDRLEDDVLVRRVTADWDDGPTGQDMIVDVLVGGASVFDGVEADMLHVAAGSNQGATSPGDIAIPEGSRNQKLAIRIAQVGSGEPGTDGTVRVVCERTGDR